MGVEENREEKRGGGTSKKAEILFFGFELS